MWICKECGEKYGTSTDGISCFHVDTCDFCGEEKAVTEDRDYNFPPPPAPSKKQQTMRQFKTGATRDNDDNKLDFEGFLHPLVVERFAEYMHKHRFQADGEMRDSDNWQKGMPRDAYMKSAFRHFIDWWKEHRGYESREGLEDALCALMFNIQGYLFESIKEKKQK